MAGFDPAIHDEFSHRLSSVSLSEWQRIMDARVKPAHECVAGAVPCAHTRESAYPEPRPPLAETSGLTIDSLFIQPAFAVPAAPMRATGHQSWW